MPTVRLFKIGCDPEFGFLDRSEEIQDANSVMTNVRPRFGLDGCNSIAELRPLPSINPSQVVRNIHDDLVKGYYDNPGIRDLYWKAGSTLSDYNETYGTGGHIHFGIHRAIDRRTFGTREEYYTKLSRYLDVYLAQPVRLLENPGELDGRLNTEYGYLGDHRENAHGMEYRVLGSWLTSPRVAEGVLCLAQTIAYQHMWLTAHKKLVEVEGLAPRKETNSYGDYNENFSMRSELRKYRSRLETLQRDIRRFKLYRQHELPIEFLFKLIEKKKSWYPGEGVDMKQAWGISASPSRAKISPSKILPPVKFTDIWARAGK